jgi:Di-haem oxidoreductase, putative peroxidase
VSDLIPRRIQRRIAAIAFAAVMPLVVLVPLYSQLPDRTLAPNPANEGIAKSLAQQIGAGRGSITTPDSSLFIINRDPFRSIRRGRQLFQRKFTRAQGQGPITGDGRGNIAVDKIIGAGLADSCAACHGRPRGSAGFGGDVVTRPDSRDAPHLFGLGLKEMLADEITADLRAARAEAISDARRTRQSVTKTLSSKGINYGTIRARPDGAVDTSGVQGVDRDLRVRPFFLHGETISIREFVVGAFNAEMGLDAVDPDTLAASRGQRITTPSGMVLDGTTDKVEAPQTDDPNADPDRDGVTNEIPVSLIDHMEFYLLNYFKAGTYEQTRTVQEGRVIFDRIGCDSCHIPDLRINRDRRVADVETVFNPRDAVFNSLFATGATLFVSTDDKVGHPPLKRPGLQPFLVRNIYTDFKRHDLGPNFHERQFDGTIRREFLTTPLWGVGSTGPYGHDGRSISLTEVILRHGGAAETARRNFAFLSDNDQRDVLEFLNSLCLFPPDDTASNLDPGDRSRPGYPQVGHGSIRLTTLFNNATDIE